jgi:hypothetical protein
MHRVVLLCGEVQRRAEPRRDAVELGAVLHLRAINNAYRLTYVSKTR